MSALKAKPDAKSGRCGNLKISSASVHSNLIHSHQELRQNPHVTRENVRKLLAADGRVSKQSGKNISRTVEVGMYLYESNVLSSMFVCSRASFCSSSSFPSCFTRRRKDSAGCGVRTRPVCQSDGSRRCEVCD